MNKAYNKITWQNKPSTATPLNQTNLNEMSNALDTIDDRVIALDNGKVSSVTVTNTLQTGDTIATITVDGTATNIKSAQVEVDAEPSATSENPLQNKAIYEMLNEILPEETAEGNPISINDASGLNAKACSVDLLPIQDLHGYDSPWVGGAGINKLANLKDGTYEGNGVKAVVKDGVATLSGTTTSSGNAIIIPLDKAVTVPNQTCYLHSMNSVQNGSVQPSIEKNGDAPNTAIAFAFTPTNRITEIPQTRYGVTVDQVRFYLASGVTLSGTFSPMICLTNTATDFIPYENICPISGRNSVTLTVNGEDIETEFPQTVYGGKLDVTNGKLTIDKSYVDLGNLTWTAQGNPNTFQAIIADFATPSNDLTCSAYPVADYSISGGNMPDKSIKSYGNSSAKYIIVKDSSYSTTSEASTGLSGVQLCYPLTTPIEITLTPEEISLLKGNNTLTTDGDNINLVYSADIKAWVESQLQS